MTDYDPEYEDQFAEENPYPPVEELDQLPSQQPGQVAIPMGQIDTGEALQGVVAFTRSVNLGTKDNNAHFRIEMPFVVQPGWSWADIAAHAADAFWHCKAVVFEQAGLPFTVDEGGVLRETLRAHFPDAEPETRTQPRRQAPTQRRSSGQGQRRGSSGDRRQGSGSGRFPHPREMEQPEHISDEVWDDLVHNFGGWHDNRPRKAGPWVDRDGLTQDAYKATASDFVRKSDRLSVWLRPFAQSANSQRGRGYDDS